MTIPETSARRRFCACQMMVLSALTLGGCALETSETAQDVQSDNGTHLNGIHLNGIHLNGTSLSGLSVNGISVNGTSATGGALKAATGSAQPLSGSSMVGSSWSASLSDGSTLALRIDSAAAGASPNTDIWMYGVSYQTQSGWLSLCTDSTGAPLLADSVAGVWNQQQGVTGGGAYSTSTSQFTFACRGASIAKCEELGYKTWKGYTNQLTSCVRLLRADVCGNGQPYTVDGQQVNLYDKVGIEFDTEAWLAEAEWTPNGAKCMSNKSTAYARYLATGTTPTCITSKALPVTDKCGAFTSGVYVVSEIPAN